MKLEEVRLAFGAVFPYRLLPFLQEELQRLRGLSRALTDSSEKGSPRRELCLTLRDPRVKVNWK